MQDTPREIVITPAREPAQQQSAPPGIDSLGLDLSNVIGSLQQSIEQMRQAAQAEIARLQAEHERERNQLHAEIEHLRALSSSQGERLQGLQSRMRALIEDYRGDLELQARRAEAARSQLQRVEQVVAQMDEATSPQGLRPSPAPAAEPASAPAVAPQELPAQAQRRVHIVESWQGPAAEGAEDNTVRMAATPSADPGAAQLTQIAIHGVSSVSAMMRARKAVEGLPGIEDIESRYVSDGTLYFSVRTQEDPQTLARELTSLPDPNLRTVQLSDNAIELEM